MCLFHAFQNNPYQTLRFHKNVLEQTTTFKHFSQTARSALLIHASRNQRTYCIEAQNTTAAPLQQHSKHAISAHCVFTVCSPIWPHCVGVMLSFSPNQR